MGLHIRKTMAPPIKIDDLKIKKICDAIAEGNTRECAAMSVGVHLSTLKRWLEMGNGDEEPYATFRAKVYAADADAERTAVRPILQAAKIGDWKAGLAWLGLRKRKKWKQYAAAQEPPETKKDITHATDEELEKALRTIQELRQKKTG
jgi:hypothetical protein